MNNLPRHKLLEIVRRHGREIINEPRRCEGLMRDNFPMHRREIAVLTSVLEERIPAELLNAGNSRTPRRALLARLAARLHDDVAMEASAARWAVHAWALALGIITPDELDALERADAQVIAPETKSTTPQQTAPPALASPAPPSAPAARASFVVALDGSGDFRTLTDAIRRAPEGSLLLVRPGIYHEGLLIEKELEIVGDGPLEAIIVRSHASSCFVLRTDAATIRNLTLRVETRAGGAHTGGFFAVDIAHGRPLIEACDISSDSLACVAIHNPTAAPLIRACRIHHGADSGVYAFDGAQGVIEACDIHENTNIGVAITGGATTSLRDCHIRHGADAGLVVWERAASAIENCEIYANRRANVGVSDAGLASLRRCRIHDGENTGVFTHRDGSATMEECDIYAHTEAEIAVSDGGDMRLRDCRIHEGQAHGVFVRDAGRALLEACDVFRNHDAGLHIDANGVAIARACRINHNGHVAVSCEAGGVVEVEGCDLTQNRVAAWRTNHGSQVSSRNNRV